MNIYTLSCSLSLLELQNRFLLHTELDDVAMGKPVGIDSVDLQANSRRPLVMWRTDGGEHRPRISRHDRPGLDGEQRAQVLLNPVGRIELALR